MTSPWMWLAHLFTAFAVLEIAQRAIVVVIIGEVFGPAVFMAGAAFTIAILFWSAWMETIDPQLTE